MAPRLKKAKTKRKGNRYPTISSFRKDHFKIIRTLFDHVVVVSRHIKKASTWRIDVNAREKNNFVVSKTEESESDHFVFATTHIILARLTYNITTNNDDSQSWDSNAVHEEPNYFASVLLLKFAINIMLWKRRTRHIINYYYCIRLFDQRLPFGQEMKWYITSVSPMVWQCMYIVQLWR